MGGFRFGRKVSRERLLRIIDKESPILIPMDSLIAMLPGGRERLAENDSNIGEAIRDDLNAIVSTRPCSVLLTTHTKKSISDLSVDELRSSSMQNLVRGHGSIVGQGCDSGFVIKKLSEYPQPTRFAIITKARRQAIPMSSRVVFVELEEEGYGRGYARLKEIPPEAIPPSKFAKTLFPLFLDKQEHKSRQIVYQLAFFKPRECLVGVEELLEHRAILNGSKPQVYRLNLKYKRDIHPDYLAALEAK